MSTLMALDLSGDTGWALFAPGAPPRFGTLRWRGQGHAEICGQFYGWIHESYPIFGWDAMAWEAPFLRPGDKVATIKILIGLVGICLGFARWHKMPFEEVQPKEVKKRMTDRQDAQKTDVIAACWSVGWKVGSEHEADACGVGLVAYDRIFPEQGVLA